MPEPEPTPHAIPRTSDMESAWLEKPLSPGDSHQANDTQNPPAVPGPRLRDPRGHQLVQVQFETGAHQFTYAWAGDGDLQIGDKVRTAPAWWLPNNDEGIATVCALGSDYEGDITILTKRATP